MVKKSEKHGVRSGNTLRASNTRFARKYHGESCIVRESTNLSRRQANDEADDSHLDADGVFYSLNKKGRWALPKLIKENINHDEHDARVSMYQRHKLKRRSNCVEFSCSEGQVKSVVSTSGYFNDSSLLPRNNRKEGGRRRKKGKTKTGQSKEGEGDEGQTDPDPDIRYDVFYPSPATSSISHNPKYIWLLDDSECVKSGKGHKRRNRRHPSVNWDEPNLDAEENDSFDDQQSENELDFDDVPGDVQTPEVMLIDVLEAAERARGLCTEQPKRRKLKAKKKPHRLEEDWVLVPSREDENDEAYSSSDDESNSSGSTFTRLPPTPKMESVRVILQCDTIHPYQLQETFQHRYTESQCQPRKFIIDTTEDVSEAVRKSKQAQMGFLGGTDFSSCLVFSRDASYDKGLDVYQVKFNINCSVGTIRLEALFDLMPTTIPEVIQVTAMFTSTLPAESFQKKEIGEMASADQKIMMLQLVPSVNKWNTHSVHLDDLSVDDKEEIEHISEDEALATAPTNDNERKEQYCNICFDEINPELFDSKTASCVLPCRHWFCDECWNEHIMERIHSGALKIKCPEYKCDSVADTAMLLSIVSIKHVQLLQKQRASLDVETNPNLKWCPNPRCGRVLKRRNDGKDSVTVSCECGQVVCFSCLREAHWPASCEQTTQYAQKLKKHGDDKVTAAAAVGVRGKQCPKCFRHIVKNGGCKCMVCLCGYTFCWICRSPWEGNHYSVKCRSVGTFRKTIKHVDTSSRDHQTSLYKMAVLHRNQRQTRNVRALKSTTDSLTIQLRNLMLKGVDIGASRIQNDGTPVTAKHVRDFLVQVMQLKLELNHVIEYTAVLLDGRMLNRGSRKLTHICHRLDSISKSIDADLASKGRQELLRVLGSLSHLRSLSRRGVTALVKHLALVQHIEVFDKE
ncbi:uncharacterized protein [Haliotis asinina]|uniref:uncharacterized protein n=1 Tax=Haliotis asinina TaxID=109174 RepID=UPI0035317F41